MNDKDDPVGKLLSEEDELKLREQEIKAEEEKIRKQKAAATKAASQKEEKLKPEDIAMERPQDTFRKLLIDAGYKQGMEATTKVFFSGDTDDPSWLDSVLQIANIPAKNRKMIITAWYGKTPEELGIVIEASVKMKEKGTLSKTDEKKDEDIFDISKMAEEDMKEMIKQKKWSTAVAQMDAIRAEAEERADRLRNKNQPQAPSVTNMRQVQRPVILPSGELAKGKDGAIIYETSFEPIPAGGGGSNDLMTAIVLKMLSGDGGGGANKPSAEVTKLTESVTAMSQRIETIQKDNEMKSKEDEIKRLNERLDREREEAKKEQTRLDEKYTEKLSKVIEDNKENLKDLKERFVESLTHKKELDDTIGAISSQHKKEMDELKKRVEHAQTSIERTVVSKGTETVDKMTEKVGDIAESVIKPMAAVLKDHYATVIDKTRKDMGLPDLRSSIPVVEDAELEKFAKG